MLTFDFVFSIPKGSKNLVSLRCLGGGGHGSHKSKWYRLSIYNFVSYDYNWTVSHAAAILDSKMVSIISFSNYVDVKQIYGNKIGQTYIVTRHINRVFSHYKVESIITKEFSELFWGHGDHLEYLKLFKGDTSTPP